MLFRSLPGWVSKIFHTVFDRFREMDRRLTILEGIYETKKHITHTDDVAMVLYQDLARWIDSLLHIYEKAKLKSAESEVKSSYVFGQLVDTVGETVIGTHAFWKLLAEFKCKASIAESHRDHLILNDALLKNFRKYIHNEIDKKRYTLLDESALEILRRVVSEAHHHVQDWKFGPVTAMVPIQDLKLSRKTYTHNALNQVEALDFIEPLKGRLKVTLPDAAHYYEFQSFIKSFDPSMLD